MGGGMSDEAKPRKAPLEREALLAKSLKLLGSRDYARAELAGRLAARAVSGEDVDWVLAKLREAGYLDDTRLAARKALQAREEKLVGRRRAEEELRQRRVEEAAIARGLAPAYADTNEGELALRYLRERMTAFLRDEQLEDQKQLHRAYGRLRRAGFRHGDTVRALRQHSRLAAGLDELAEPDEE